MLNQFKDNIIHILLTLILILILSHFIFFLSLIKNFKSDFEKSIKVDSIVVLTGDKFRISKGMELLTKGIGERLLLSGVNKDITLNNIKNELQNYSDYFDCCVDIDNNNPCGARPYMGGTDQYLGRSRRFGRELRGGSFGREPHR